MYRKLFIVLLVFSFIFPKKSFGENLNPINDLKNPTNLNIEVREYSQVARKGESYFIIRWKNPQSVIDLAEKEGEHIIEYQIDYKVDNNSWLSEDSSKKLPTYVLTYGSSGLSNRILDPISEKLSKDMVNIEKHNYSFRIRYRHVLQGESLYGDFSNTVSLGVLPYYSNSSAWATKDLDRAVELGLITDKVRKDMNKSITREEFMEVIVNLYEKQEGADIKYKEKVFSDTNNPEILKAAALGITSGIGEGKFGPNNLITRQEIAVAINRLVDRLYPNFKYELKSPIDFKDAKEIASWSKKSIEMVNNYGIMIGSGEGNFMPLKNTTKEETVISILRLWDKIEEKTFN